MAQPRDSSPVYYREIQKNAYLKRVPEEASGSKLKPLVLKKPPLKPLWTVLCIHNGRAPYLEQYRDAVTARAHRPVWRHCLSTARHVTASVTAKGEEYDFLVDTDDGPVRMLAPDWESMQDWVVTLRSKLVELRIVPPTENVYCAPRPAPAPPPPRAAARDPTSPLPAPPHAPPHRVPGIDLPPITRPAPVPETSETEPEVLPRPLTPPEIPSEPDPTDRTNAERYSSVNRSNASTRNADLTEATTDSLDTDRSNADRLNTERNHSNRSNTEADRLNSERNVADRLNADADSLNSERNIADRLNSDRNVNADRLDLDRNNTDSPNTDRNTADRLNSDRSNLDILLSNWENSFASLPSTSQKSVSQSAKLETKKVAKICGQNICLDDSIFKRERGVGSDEEYCDSDGDGDYRQTLLVSDGKDEDDNDRLTNITVIQVSNKAPHTAIPIINSESNVFNFELKDQSFVNVINTESADTNQYGTVFDGDYGHLSLTTTVNLTGPVKTEVSSVKTEANAVKTEANAVKTEGNSGRNEANCVKAEEGLYERLCMASTDVNSSPLSVRRLINQEKVRKSSLPNLESANPNSTYEYLFLGNNSNDSSHVTANLGIVTPIPGNNIPNSTTNITTSSTNNPNITPKLTNMPNVNPRTSNIANITSNSTARTTNITNISHRTANNTITTNNIAISTNNLPISTNNLPISTNNIPISQSTEQSRVHTNAVSCDDRLRERESVERSHSQNAYDVVPRREGRANQNENIVPNGRIEKETPKPIWKRGLTELSLLTRLRGIGQGKRQDSPTRNNDNDRNGVMTSPAKVVHRSRPEVRVDGRRRSSSLSNGQSPPAPALQPLRTRQAALLRAEQRRGTALVATVRTADPPVFVDYNKQVWVCWWGGGRGAGRAGDRVAGVAGVAPRTAAHARTLLAKQPRPHVDVLFHRVPLAKIYVISKKDQETLGIKLDGECTITAVEARGAAARAGVAPPPGAWAVTEVNNRGLNLLKGGEEEMNRLCYHGNEASILIQPTPLVKKLRAGLKGHKSLLGLR